MAPPSVAPPTSALLGTIPADLLRLSGTDRRDFKFAVINELPTVVGRLVDWRVMVLGGSDGRLVFGRAVHHRHVFMLVLGDGDGSLLPQDVSQRSGRQERG